MEQTLQQVLQRLFNKDLSTASETEVFRALMVLTQEELERRPLMQGTRKLYYISAEFLIGKLLSNNLINLGLFDEAREVLTKYGFRLEQIEEQEREPSLGNGGLGRLAACFLDSLAALGLPGDGVGLNYHYGLFYQKLSDLRQREEKDAWIATDCWLRKTDVRFPVQLGQETVLSTMYDIDIPGWNGGRNCLHLFDLDTVDGDGSVIRSGIQFDKTDILHCLTLFLYPDDSDEAGRLLRVYQQYFMVSNAAQLILHELEERGGAVENLHEYAAVQINDTHPAMIIPELIRLLMMSGLSMDQAVSEVRQTCAYTNHTILAEALEKWPLSYLERAVPVLVPILRELDERVRRQYDDPQLWIIDEGGVVHMARLAIHYGCSVNGVAALHTEILKQSELRPFYEIYPERFHNITNGITFRRWLLHCNPWLTAWVKEQIGDGFQSDAGRLEGLLAFREDAAALQSLAEAKHSAKREFARWLKQTQDVEADPDSIFDVQVKRLHEYKRQQLNLLYAVYQYLNIRAGKFPARPVTMIFGAKAAPAYTIAKDIIHLILCMSRLVESDPLVRQHLKIVMLENYNVTKAEKVIPACDISEQISLASKEASGTGNMKFMLNGAVTLGTMDGANVEIAQLVGDENIAIFGRDSSEVIRLYDSGAYRPQAYYAQSEIGRLVDFICGGELLSIGNAESLYRLHYQLVSKDPFMTLLDLEDYIRVKDHLLDSYEDRPAWMKRSLVNIAKAGFFSSDRSISEYNRDIWHLK